MDQVNPLSRRHFFGGLGVSAAAIALAGCGGEARAQNFPFRLSDTEWRARLSPAAYRVLRDHGTERPFTSPLDRETRAGTYACAGCALPLYPSRTKFDSGTGWPSFWAALPDATGTSRDLSMGIPRTEVHCRRCGGHLGHIFDDGPRPTGKRHCLNGVALTFRPA